MRVIDVEALFGSDLFYSYSHDKTRVTFRCVCGKHSSGEGEYNAVFNIMNGFYYTFGSCGVKMLPFRVLNKNLASSRLKAMKQFLYSVGREPVYRTIDNKSITAKVMSKFFWGDFLVQKRIAVNSQYLKDRKVPRELIEKFQIFHDDSDSQIVFPLTDYSGKKNGVQIRYNNSNKTKYRIVRDKRTNVSPLHVLKDYDRSKPLYIVEGMFGMLNLVKHGHQAVCVLGKSGLRDVESLSQFDKIVGCFDRDEAGAEYAKKLLQLQLPTTVVQGAEFDELTSDEFDAILGHESRYVRSIGEFYKPKKHVPVAVDYDDYLEDDE